MENTEMTYPEKMLRGISSFDFIQEGILTEEVFNLDPVREDGYCEISITWYENQEAFDIIMNQLSERRNELQFKAGVAELDRIELSRKMKNHFINSNIKYERKPSLTNKYHGNLLVKNDLNKQMKRLIKCGLATLANEKIYQNPNFKNSSLLMK